MLPVINNSTILNDLFNFLGQNEENYPVVSTIALATLLGLGAVIAAKRCKKKPKPIVIVNPETRVIPTPFTVAVAVPAAFAGPVCTTAVQPVNRSFDELTLPERVERARELCLRNTEEKLGSKADSWQFNHIKKKLNEMPMPALEGLSDVDQIILIRDKLNEALQQATQEILVINKQRRKKLNNDLATQNGGQLRPYFEMKDRSLAKKLDQRIAGDVQFTEEKLAQHRSRINAYLIYSQTRNIPLEQIGNNDTDRANFEAFFQHYLVDEANRNASQFTSEVEKAPKKAAVKTGKKSKPVKATTKQTGATISTEKSQAPEAPVALTAEQLRMHELTTTLLQPARKSARRVRRWDFANAAAVREFKDFKNGAVVTQYALKSDEDLQKQMWFHGTMGTDCLIGSPAYTFTTSKGCGMLCRIQPHDPRKPAIYGTLYFGIGSDGVVYHRSCVEQSTADSTYSILSGGAIPDPQADVESDPSAEEKHMELVGHYQVTISDQAVIRFAYPRKKYSIYIYPVRTDLLTPGLFSV